MRRCAAAVSPGTLLVTFPSLGQASLKRKDARPLGRDVLRRSRLLGSKVCDLVLARLELLCHRALHLLPLRT